MGRSFMPRGHIEKREQQDLGLFSGVTPRESKFKVDRIPGQQATANYRKLSEYGKQLRAHQLAKRLYGILERQFRNYYKKACQLSGSTGENLLRLLELRLDNIVYRLGFARTRKEARQLVSHRSVIVFDGKTKRIVNIPSFQVKPGYEIFIKEKSQNQLRIQEALTLAKERAVPAWLETMPENLKGKVIRFPDREEMPSEINELLIVELYSK